MLKKTMYASGALGGALYVAAACLKIQSSYDILLAVSPVPLYLTIASFVLMPAGFLGIALFYKGKPFIRALLLAAFVLSLFPLTMQLFYSEIIRFLMVTKNSVLLYFISSLDQISVLAIGFALLTASRLTKAAKFINRVGACALLLYGGYQTLSYFLELTANLNHTAAASLFNAHPYDTYVVYSLLALSFAARVFGEKKPAPAPLPEALTLTNTAEARQIES